MPEEYRPFSPVDADDPKLSLLMKNCKIEYIDDDGFTARVMAAIPRDRNNAGTNRRCLLLVSASILSVLLILLLGGRDFLAGASTLIQRAVNGPVLILPGISLGVLPAACLLAGLGIASCLGYRHLRQAFR